ncbi:hypothetical protein ACH4JZ_14765 [Streptomyces sp. NPDC017615]|uniref:hypothetical protein n=1 Tax=Streptomyces sp. NPDC017615 TaxID=3365003 RepID=UPI0037B0841D
MIDTQSVKTSTNVPLISPPHENERELGVFGHALAAVLVRHVKVTGIDDVLTSAARATTRSARPAARSDCGRGS